MQAMSTPARTKTQLALWALSIAALLVHFYDLWSRQAPLVTAMFFLVSIVALATAKTLRERQLKFAQDTEDGHSPTD